MEHKKKQNEKVIKSIFNSILWQENVTVVDLSNKKITQFDESLKLPSNLIVLNLSNNQFDKVPPNVLILENLKMLDVSYNNIVLFDETPAFCHTLECLKLNNNKLVGPPYWVWCENPRKLVELNISNNVNMCQAFDNYYLEELLQYTSLIKSIDLHCCRLSKNIKLMSTFRHARFVILGNKEYDYLSVNHIENIPCDGLEDCYDIEVLDLCNTHIYNLQHNIDIYQNLREINLSQNNINSLPNEFCNLKNLEICYLSLNKILYLPDDMNKLENLKKLYLDSNELCMLPENIHELKKLKTLDLYNNHLYEGLVDISNLEQYDFAQNYEEEPNDQEYLVKKENLRQFNFRLDGRAKELVHLEEEKYEEEYDDSEWYHNKNDENAESKQYTTDSRCSSPEDWDSDSYWIPSAMDIDSRATPLYRKRGNTTSPSAMQWLDFVKKKMKEGNFCPMDMHLTISITEKVKYEKMCNPELQYESDGQFDDFSDDDT